MSERNRKEPNLRELFPELSDKELEVAEENMRRYASLLGRMYRRLLREGYFGSRRVLTDSERDDKNGL